MSLSYWFGGCYSAYFVDSQASKTGVTWALGQGNKTDELSNQDHSDYMKWDNSGDSPQVVPYGELT